LEDNKELPLPFCGDCGKKFTAIPRYGQSIAICGNKDCKDFGKDKGFAGAFDWTQHTNVVEIKRAVNLEGVGPDAPTLDNGIESHSPYRFDLMPPLAMASIAKVLAHGAKKYGDWSFLDLPSQSSLNHMQQHVYAYISGDLQEGDHIEHARHAACRAVMWLELLERERLVNEAREEPF